MSRNPRTKAGRELLDWCNRIQYDDRNRDRVLAIEAKASRTESEIRRDLDWAYANEPERIDQLEAELIAAEASRPPASGDALDLLRELREAVFNNLRANPLKWGQINEVGRRVDAFLGIPSMTGLNGQELEWLPLAATPPPAAPPLDWTRIFKAFGKAFGVGIDPSLREKVIDEYARLSPDQEEA